MITNDVDGIPDMGRVWTMDLSELAMESKPFAKGAFGHVYKGEYFGTPVCIKILKGEDPNECKLMQREVTSLKFEHPNLVQFMGVAEKDEEILIITEYIHGGNLRQYLKDERVHIPWALRTQIAKDIACGMAFLHSKGIIHRDLKSKNLLVGDNWRIKICDFGFARSVSRRQLMTVCGTGEWMAPEVLQGVDYDEKADVYSFGIVLCELITRRKATDDLPRSPTNFSLDVSKLVPLVPEDCPPELYNLAISCVAYDSHARPPFKEIIPILKNLLTALIPTSTTYPRPSSFSLLCSSTGAPPPNTSTSNMTPMQQQMHQQKLQRQLKEQQQQQHQQHQHTHQQHQQQNYSTSTSTKERTNGRAHAATSPPPYVAQQQASVQHNGFGHQWSNETDNPVSVSGGSAPSRGVVWSENWEDKGLSMGPLFVSNRLNPARTKLPNNPTKITSSSKPKKDNPPSPPPLLFSSSTPPTLISFSPSTTPTSTGLTTSSTTRRTHAPTVHSSSPASSPSHVAPISQSPSSVSPPKISATAAATAQFHLLNTSSHSTRNTNAPHLATSPPKMHEKFTSMNPNALAMSR